MYAQTYHNICTFRTWYKIPILMLWLWRMILLRNQGWSNPIARRPGLVISEVGQVKIYLSLAHGQLDFSSPPVLNYYH